MKVRSLIFSFFSFFLVGTTYGFGAFQNQLYCDVQGGEISIFVRKIPDTYRCDSYITTLDEALILKYDEILLAMKYKKTEKPAGYWANVYEIKRDEFTKLLSYKIRIQDAIDQFESKFFDQYHTLIANQLTPYLYDLKNLELHGSPGNPVNREQLAKQIEIVTAILNAASIDEIINNIGYYIYLKGQLN